MGNVLVTGKKSTARTVVEEVYTRANALMTFESSRQSGSLETRLITINAATDCATTATGPIAAELFLANGFTAGAKRARATWHTEPIQTATTTDVPHASSVYITLNATTDVTAIARLSYVDSTVGSSSPLATDLAFRVISASSPMVEWDLYGSDSTIDDIYAVAQLPDDAANGVIPVYVSIEVW